MKRSIVLIENDVEECKLYQSMLTGAPDARYSVLCAATVDEGLAAIEGAKPDCVLLEYAMPGQGSEAAWHRIRARYPFLPVVMLTGDDADFEALAAMRAEGQEYLRKSAASPETLHQAVSNGIMAAASRAEGSTSKSGHNVLIIDDNPDDREAFIRALRKVDETCTCLEAGEGQAGMKMIEENRPDCVLLDYSLPALNGLEVLKRIHAIDAYLPVIMLTGLGNETVAVQSMKGGAQNYIVKTALTPRLLHSAIISAIEHSALERKISEQRNQIYEQKAELARSHRLNEAVLNSAAYMIIATDSEGIVLVFNPEAERQLGYSADEVVGKQTPLLWLDQDELGARSTEMSKEMGAIMEPDFTMLTHKAVREDTSRQEWTCVRRDGERFTANLSITPLRDTQNDVTGFLVVAEDITLRKHEQDTLKAQEELFRSSMEHAPGGMAFVDIGGKFLKVNETLCEMLGYTADQLQGKHQDSVTEPEDIEMDLENVRQLLSGRIQAYKTEKRMLKEDGSPVQVMLAMSMMRNPDGTPGYFVAQYQDITDRKEIDKLKSDLVSMVSHELRTPVTSIRGAVGLLSSLAAKDLSPRAKQLIEIANKNCDRLTTLINDVLDIDKMAHGQMRFDMKEEDIAALLQEAIEAHRGYSERVGIGVVMEPVATNLMVNVDAARLIQVMFNLLSNATKHSPEGGQIRVGAGRSGDKIRIWVKDQGPGVEEEFVKRLFEKYTQGNQADMRGAASSGLGLHISKQIIEHMGGSIGLDTKIGVGSTFWVELPERRATENAIPSDRRGQMKRILVCEDDDNVAALIQLMLSKEGFITDVVHTIPEARRMLTNGIYDAMTLDVTLPLGDGLDLAREVHGSPDTRTLPIVVISGRYRDQDGDIEQTAGIVDWIVKPFDKERLVKSVEKAAAEPLKLVHSA
jgi:PAS domain S-box-containing protein